MPTEEIKKYGKYYRHFSRAELEVIGFDPKIDPDEGWPGAVDTSNGVGSHGVTTKVVFRWNDQFWCIAFDHNHEDWFKTNDFSNGRPDSMFEATRVEPVQCTVYRDVYDPS